MLFFELKDKQKKLEYHLYDLKKYLIFSFIFYFIIFSINFYFAKNLINFFQKPLLQILYKYNFTSNPFIVTSLPEGFISYIKFTFYVSTFFYIPILIFQILFYLVPVLHKNIRKEVIIVMSVFAPILFYLGIAGAYYFTFHIIWNFLINFNLSRNLGIYLKISEYINLALHIILWSGICFELPIILYTLYRVGIINYEGLKKFKKIAILLAFILAAIVTPPDPFSQIIMAGVLIVFYEVTLIVIKKMN